LRQATIWFLLLIALLGVMGLSVGVGPARVSLAEVGRVLGAHLLGRGGGDLDRAGQIIWEIRVPRTLVALLVGASLAVAGTLMQGFFQNPMADPYLIGVSAGASLGATLALTLKWTFSLLGFSAVPFCAFAGALGVTVTVYLLARRGGRVPAGTLLLTGIAVGSLASALTSCLIVFSPHDIGPVVFWLMGSLANRDWSHVAMVAPYFGIGVAVVSLYARDLNVLLLGDEAAMQLGLEVERVKLILLTVAALLAAAAVAVSGIIGFVGLIVPHLTRLLVGPDHRRLLPMAAITGAILLTGADLLARSLARIEIPIGIITALLGGPFFLYLLARRRDMVL